MATGIWDEGRRHGSHSFLLSPDVYRISADWMVELDELAKAVQRCLLGVSRLVAIASDSSLHNPSDAYGLLYQRLTRGAPYNLHALRPANIPLLCKVDLMVDRDGNFKIAEIDATNPRSWGYSVIGRRLCALASPESQMLPGVIAYLAKHLSRQNAKEVCFLYGHTQRFYAPEFAIVAGELKSFGIQMTVIDEIDVVVKPDHLLDAKSGAVLPEWFIDFPMMNRNKPLIDWLKGAARERRVEFVIPPKHFLSSKAVLATLCKSGGDASSERLLLTQIAEGDLFLVRHYLPPTRLVAKGEAPGDIRSRVAERPHLLKACVSSGMKGVVFSDEAGFEQTLETALNQNGGYVLQQEVNGLPHRFGVYGPNGTLAETHDWFVRLTGYFSRDGLQDIAVSACRDKRVHGGTQAIVTGTVIT